LVIQSAATHVKNCNCSFKVGEGNPDEVPKELEPANDEVDMLDALVCKLQ
jgi:hypothetical protein